MAMHRPICWSELTSGSVGLWGLGVEGGASFRRLQSMGTVPVLVEDVPHAPDYKGLEVLATGAGGLQALLRCDVVVKSPGISRYRPDAEQLVRSGVALSGGLGLWLEEAPLERVTCITGTKGKSTTTALATHILNGLGHRARAGGNIGTAPWDPDGGPAPEYWVIETSSFQVPDLTRAPSVVAVTSLFPDHLDWHGTVERYYADKLSLCTKEGVKVAIAPGADDVLRAQLRSSPAPIRWVDAEPENGWRQAIGLLGAHNARNAAVARAVLEAMGITEARDDERMATAAEGFSALPSRCRSLGAVGGIEFIDDSLSTNVLPAQAALDAFDGRPVALLVGGYDRGLDYAPLARSVAARQQPTLVVTMPDNGPRIGEAIRAVNGSSAEVVDSPDLAEAVATAYRWSTAGGVVLLSPAAPSFGQFADYRDRAAAFAAAAARCGPLN